METNLWHLFAKGGWVMWPLLAFSVITWAVVIERAYFFFRVRKQIGNLGNSLLKDLRSGDKAAAKQLLQSQKPELNEVFLGAIDPNKNKDLAERSVDRSRIRLMGYFKRNLWLLGTVASASPFVGLLGTVVGIVKAFHEMAEKGAGGFSVVAAGISEALIATAAGLVVAIIALVTYNLFVNTANQTLSSIKLTLDELLDLAHESKA